MISNSTKFKKWVINFVLFNTKKPCALRFLILSYSDTQQRSTSSGDWLIISVDATVVINSSPNDTYVQRVGH